MRQLIVSFLIMFISPLGFAQVANFESYGNFQQMMKSGDSKAKVNLSSLPNSPGYWGVGALAGLNGEIIQIDGALLVSHGSNLEGAVTNFSSQDQAVLWAGGRVNDWKPILISSDMSQPEFEKFIMKEAGQHSLNLSQPLLFRVTGQYAHLIWHVITGKQSGESNQAPGDGAKAKAHGHHGGGHANKQAGMNLFRNPSASGQLVVVYSGDQLEGVVSHPGERFHIHYIDDAKKLSGHVDQYTVQKGSTLWLPFDK